MVFACSEAIDVDPRKPEWGIRVLTAVCTYAEAAGTQCMPFPVLYWPLPGPDRIRGMTMGEPNRSDTLAPWQAVSASGVVGLAMGAGFGPVSVVLGSVLGASTGWLLVKVDRFRDSGR